MVIPLDLLESHLAQGVRAARSDVVRLVDYETRRVECLGIVPRTLASILNEAIVT
jgi:hypothetical protein